MNNLLLILKLIPSIIAAIRAIEETLPDTVPGKVKLQAILDIAVQVDSTVSNIIPQLTNTISILVALFNATGLFKSKKVVAEAVVAV